MGNFTSLHERRKQRNRTSLKKKSKGMLRLTVFRSSRHIYGQIIDDENNIWLSIFEFGISKYKGNAFELLNGYSTGFKKGFSFGDDLCKI